jgi:hypothetical protein
LTSLDVAGFTALYDLQCRNNKLKTLDIRDCTGFDRVFCLFNELETVHVLGAKLKILRMISNKLTAAELNRIFTDLQNRSAIGSSGQLYIGTNPGTDDCDRSIATGKGWIFY